MKKSSSFTKRLIATCIAVAMVIGSMSTAVFADVEAAQSGSSAFIGFKASWRGFNVYGISGSGEIKTTYNDAGYGTKLSVDGQSVATDNNGFAYGKDYSVAGVTTHLTAAINETGKAVVITYTITNTNADAKTVQIGSYSDCMIGTNDRAPVRVHNNGLSMTDGTNNFFLIPGDGNFTTLWSGRYSGADSNVFTNSASHDYSGDSGLAWSWTLDIPAGETVTKTAILEADFQTFTLSFDANHGTGTMDSCYVVSGISSTIPANAFTRNGYEFRGWATSSDATEVEYRDGGYITLTSDVTLYALWEQVAPVEATFADEPDPIENLTYTGQPQTLVDPGTTDEGTIVYSLSEDGPFTTELPTITASGTYTVYYKIEGDEFHEDSTIGSFEVTIAPLTVTANVNGEEVAVNAESTLTRPADPTREGYDFGGWYADEACTTAYNFNAPIGASGATLYPQWIPYEYTLTEGGEGSWTRGGSEGLVFRAVRTNNGAATFDHFTGVKVDNNTLGDSNYEAISGSVIVTLTPAYLATLADGQHTLEIMFDDGSSVTTTFTIAAQVVETTAAETTATPTETTAAATSGVASTGETQTSSTAPIGIAILMIAGAATMIFIVRKREENS